MSHAIGAGKLHASAARLASLGHTRGAKIARKLRSRLFQSKKDAKTSTLNGPAKQNSKKRDRTESVAAKGADETTKEAKRRKGSSRPDDEFYDPDNVLDYGDEFAESEEEEESGDFLRPGEEASDENARSDDEDESDNDDKFAQETKMTHRVMDTVMEGLPDAPSLEEAAVAVNEDQHDDEEEGKQEDEVVGDDKGEEELGAPVRACAAARQVSNFLLDDKVFFLSPAKPNALHTKALFSFHKGEFFHFYGAIEVTVIAGSLRCAGYTMTAAGENAYKCYSAPHSLAQRLGLADPSGPAPSVFPSPQAIQALETTSMTPEGNQLVEVLKGMQTDADVDKTKILALAVVSSVDFKGLPFSKAFSTPKISETQTTHILQNLTIIDVDHEQNQLDSSWSNSWHEVARQVLLSISANKAKREVMVVGKKGAGKSTLCRFLINSLLSKHKEVAFLDLDVGQSELSPPGLVSLCVLSQPLLGPSYANLHDSQQITSKRIHKAQFFGHLTPQSDPNGYIAACYELYDHYVKTLSPFNDPQARMPLVINSLGWVEGFGYTMLMDLINYMSPARIVQLYKKSEGGHAGRDFFPIHPADSEHLKISRGILINLLPISFFGTPLQAIGSADKRALQVSTYFRILGDNSSVGQDFTYRVPWSKLRIHIAHPDVSPSQALYALNGMLVGLVIDTESYAVANEALATERDNYPSFLVKAPSYATSSCVGLGLVKMIDTERKLLWIVTPVSAEKLKLVNTIVRGSLELPPLLMVKESTTLNTPYLTSDAIGALGAEKMKGRTDLQRKRLQKPN